MIEMSLVNDGIEYTNLRVHSNGLDRATEVDKNVGRSFRVDRPGR